MYFFYVDESGNRDPSSGTAFRPKDHIYVLLAVGLYERQWRPFELEISRLKLELAHYLHRDGNPRFGLVDAYYDQLNTRNAVILASIIDKRELRSDTTHDVMHRWAYELLLERIEHYMRQYHHRHQALIVMDDTNTQLNQFIAMEHAALLRRGNPNMLFPHIVEYPFFTRSELSNGVQLADLLAYNVYRAFRDEDVDYPYFRTILPKVYRRRDTGTLAGLKVWPETSPLVDLPLRPPPYECEGE
ncbi:MAG: DUF3800 domain-containing protein [Gammaproteobacteria bacterium]|nr:DUF3800 domain-containing protein [Gammaproteobacteria bacterium]